MRRSIAILAILLPTLVAGVAISQQEAVTFNDDVLPILQNRCQSCHRLGEVAPMPLLTYRDVRPWARAIREVVITREMPPWFAEQGVGRKLHNDPSLTRGEIDTIVSWVDNGAKRGNPKSAPEPVEFVDGWQIEPDMIIETPDFDIPPEGIVEYTYYIISDLFTEDTWVTKTEMRPTNRSVTHHLIAYVRPPESSYFSDYPVGEYFIPDKEGRRPREEESVFDWRQLIGGYAPGMNSGEQTEHGDALLIEAGSDVIFEVHYTPNGMAATDAPKLGLEIADEPPAHRRLVSAAANGKFEIPPGDPNHQVDASITLAEDVSLRALMPHMHLRGKAFEFRAVYPTGETEVLLRVPRYDFNWQLFYYLAEPLELPKGTTIECTAFYDNSAKNPYNPDPTREVTWGDQSWEEMMIGWFEVSFPADTDPKVLFKSEDEERRAESTQG